MNYLTQLIQILNTEKELYIELTELAQEKQDAIVNNEVEELAECLKKEDSLILEIEEAGRERRNVVIALCNELDINDKELSFTQLREFINEDARKYLDHLKQNLLEVLDRLHQINETNKLLIEQSLSINEYTLGLLTQVRNAQPTYTKEGSDYRPSEKNIRLIDKKI